MMLAPCFAKATAIARPIPLVDPVTRAVFPRKVDIDAFLIKLNEMIADQG
jgi:hypothetical protein